MPKKKKPGQGPIVTLTFAGRVFVEGYARGKPVPAHFQPFITSHEKLNEAIRAIAQFLNSARLGKIGETQEARAQLQGWARTILRLKHDFGQFAFQQASRSCSSYATTFNYADSLEEAVRKALELASTDNEKAALEGIIADLRHYRNVYEDCAQGNFFTESLLEPYRQFGSTLLTECICQALQHIRSYLGLRDDTWRDAQAKWLSELETWKATDPDRSRAKLLALREQYDPFTAIEKSLGPNGKGLLGSLDYFNFLRETSALNNWRNEATAQRIEVNDLTQDDWDKIKKKHHRNRGLARLECLFKKNPELRALHGVYTSFLREVGVLPEPPTYTEPHFVHHPRFFVLSASDGYKNLDLSPRPNSTLGAVQLRLLGEDSNGTWIKASFFKDRRLKRVRAVREDEESSSGYIYDDPIAGPKPITFCGIRIRKDGDVFYLDFTVQLEAKPQSEATKAVKFSGTEDETAGAAGDNPGKKKTPKALTLEPGTIVAATTFHPDGYAFTCVWKIGPDNGLLLLRQLKVEAPVGKSGFGLGSGAESRLAEQTKSQRRKSGRRTKGQGRVKGGKKHLLNIRAQRNKELASRIMKFVCGFQYDSGKRRWIQTGPAATVHLMESAKRLSFGTGQSSDHNREMQNLAIAALLDLIRSKRNGPKVTSQGMDLRHGIKSFERNRFGWDETCPCCRQLGFRYSIVKYDSDGNRLPVEEWIKRDWNGEHFVCPNGCKSDRKNYKASAMYVACFGLLMHLLDPSYLDIYSKRPEKGSPERDAAVIERDDLWAQVLPELLADHNLVV